MIAAYHLGGWKSKINLGVNMPWDSHFREIQEPPQPQKRQGHLLSNHQGQ